MTIRLAIGAGPGRLLKQLLTESLLLSALGLAGGLLVANWSRNALGLLFPPRGGVSMYLPGEINWHVLALCAVVCLTATFILGIVPAFQSRDLNLAGALKSDSAGIVGGRRSAWVRSGLVVVQVSLSFVLLVVAGLLLQSLQKIRTSNPGFSTHEVMFTAVDLVSAGYDVQRAQGFQDELVDRVRALPAVESASFARATPLSYGSFSSTRRSPLTATKPHPEEQPTVEFNEVGPDYFVTMGIPLVSGREFARADDEKSPSVAVVNETMALRYWRGENPIGERVQVKGRWMQVIGVAKDSKYNSIREEPRPFFYVARRQNFSRCRISVHPRRR